MEKSGEKISEKPSLRSEIINTDIYKEIKDAIQKMGDGIMLLLVDTMNYSKANISIVYHLSVEKGLPGVYVTLNKPYDTVKTILEKEGINTASMIFVDGVTKTDTGGIERTDECLYLGGPEKLTDVSIAMSEAVTAMPAKEKFAFFDSLGTLLIYYSPETVAKFAHFLINKMREWGATGVIISMKNDTDERLLGQLTQFCNTTVNLSKGGEKGV